MNMIIMLQKFVYKCKKIMIEERAIGIKCILCFVFLIV